MKELREEGGCDKVTRKEKREEVLVWYEPVAWMCERGKKGETGWVRLAESG